MSKSQFDETIHGVNIQRLQNFPLKLTEEDIKQKLHDRIAKYMIPEKILFLEKIPKTPGLKTDKRAIRALFFPE